MKLGHQKNIKLFITVVAVLIVAGLVVFLKLHRPQTLTRYEDSSGVVYECSKPVKAKEGTAKLLLGHPQGLIPEKAEDASKYCHSVGIE